jgi:hypothetical protein
MSRATSIPVDRSTSSRTSTVWVTNARALVPRFGRSIADGCFCSVGRAGFHNCISNCILPQGAGINCTAGGPVRASYSLMAQMEATRAPALLLLPEVAYDQASSDPGALGTSGGWAALLSELLATPEMVRVTGGVARSVDDIHRMEIFSHSGAYVVAGSIATIGNVSAVRGVTLFDSLYGDFSAFDTYLTGHLSALGNSSDADYRFANVYTCCGGTANNSLAQETRFAGWLSAAGASDLLLFDDTYDTLPDEAFGFPVLFKRSELAHDSVPSYYLSRFIANSFIDEQDHS